ncbi:hypothetical protein [Paenarthrobacter sp. NPDC090522]|uniref:hypothetical protein n=1 Tax=Paenarthrobacter sp. NPDC090522 TaxID=3364383 RepID=UPI003804AF65
MSALTSINNPAALPPAAVVVPGESIACACHDPEPPILDLKRLQLLADELASSEEAQRFLSAFVLMLPQRIERIVDSVMDHDDKGLTVALLSLGTASNMVGALELEAICHNLENLAEAGSFPAIVLELPVIRAASARFRAAAQWNGEWIAQSTCHSPAQGRQESAVCASDSWPERR